MTGMVNVTGMFLRLMVAVCCLFHMTGVRTSFCVVHGSRPFTQHACMLILLHRFLIVVMSVIF